jgi:hypothetical protein
MGQEQDGVESGFQSSQCFIGKYSNVVFYNRTLSDSEILQNFQALRGRYNV